ncbi:Saf4/Yju2 family protein [Nostoc sp. LEGE 12447]|uniref:Saf4/Yju2 family protein n=1 Tax=Nostoc sp. LEGE 12447 TaxID=1828640 RepID=UPI001D150585|nr:Saf4/Yju2 family protein [Nostoc sp. LEGE 12447]
MKALENRTLDSQVEMDILDALDEIKSLNARNAKVDLDGDFIEQFKKRQEEV